MTSIASSTGKSLDKPVKPTSKNDILNALPPLVTEYIKLTHYRQEVDWDCGIACAYSILKYFDIQISYNELISSLTTHSIWTIDLVYLLNKYKLNIVFNTITIGVDSSLSIHKKFYNELSNDENRVNQLFKQATTSNIIINKKEMSNQEIIDQLNEQVLLLLLVDDRYLTCIQCDVTDNNNIDTIAFARKALKSEFQGHFVILNGISKDNNTISYINPSKSHNQCYINMAQLELARRSHGTDQDCICIFTNSTSEHKSNQQHDNATTVSNMATDIHSKTNIKAKSNSSKSTANPTVNGDLKIDFKYGLFQY